MRIGNQENYIDIDLQLECDSSIPSYGDALVSIVVSSNGYLAKNQIWVSQEELRNFNIGLSLLEEKRKGEAVLSSMSPGELFLKVYAYNGLGHIAISGETGHLIVGDVNFNHSIKFGFTIEPEQLVKLSKIKWQV